MEDLSVLSSLFSRREFLRGVGAFSAASLTIWAGGCDACLTQIQNQIANRPTRRNIQNLPLSDPVITTFKAAVTAMRGLPSSDPRNYTNQATIHNNLCTHSNWLWLPWHRVHLVYFERICRKLTGDDSFALPYWNWVTHPAVPDAFWDTSSPLYDSTRGITQADPADPSYVGASVIQNILNETNFNLFASGPPPTSDLHSPGGPSTGMLEGTPHNNIHNFVGGDMGTFMSPLDPVFWTHHNMLDCLWTDWNINLGNSNTNDTNWTNHLITDFVDENGNPTSVQVIDTVLFPILSYQFEPCSLTPQGGAMKQAGDRQALEKFLRAGAPSKLEFSRRFELKQSFTAEVGKPAAGAIKIDVGGLREALEGGPKNRAVLTVADVDIPEKRDFFVRVFVGKADASAATSIDDPHYAGSFGFFFDETILKKHGGEHGDMGMSGRPKTGYLVDITPTLRKLNQAGSLSSDKVDVSFVAVPYGKRESKGHLALQRLELGVASF
jgi:tyrosinase